MAIFGFGSTWSNNEENEGRLTNIRAATMYEECLPLVQTRILEKLFRFC